MPADGATSDETVPPAGDIINQDVALSTVAQAESIRAYFLAQTLESTKTVPVVSAKLPLDQGTNQQPQSGADGGQIAVGSEDKVTDGDLPTVSTEAGAEGEPEGGEDSDESDLAAPSVSVESTVVGSFIYRGITYAVEPGGESVAIVSADYSKLPSEFIEAQTIVLPSMVSSDGIDYYTVSRIADHAFSSLTEEVALEASDDGDAGASSDVQAKAEASAYEGESDPSAVGEDVDVVDPKRSDVDTPADVVGIVAGGAAASVDGIDPSSDDAADLASDAEGSGVSEGDELPEPDAASSIGVTAITIPASITEIGDDAFSGFDTLQYVIVSADNPNYSMYDGCLYDKPTESLLLIPEGRLGAVWVAPDTVGIAEDASSHCAHLTTLIVDPDSAASQLLEENDLYNANGEKIEIVSSSAQEIGTDDQNGPLDARYSEERAVEIGEPLDLLSAIVTKETAPHVVASDDLLMVNGYDEVYATDAGSVEMVLKASRDDGADAFDAVSVRANDPNDSEAVLLSGESSQSSLITDSAMTYDAAYGFTYTAGQRARFCMGVAVPGVGNSIPIDNGYNSVTAQTEFIGSITWTGGSSTGPTPGSVVMVNVTSVTMSGRTESFRETMTRRSIEMWGGSETRMLTGFRDTGGAGLVNSGTGAFISLDNLFGDDAFTFTFIYPSSGCSISSSGLRWDGGSYCFVPEFTEVSGYIYTNFEVNGSGGNFTNAAKGVVGQSSYGAAVYSKIGETLKTPSSSVTRSNYRFTGWYTTADCVEFVGSIQPQSQEDWLSLNGTTFYAGWAATSSGGGQYTYNTGDRARLCMAIRNPGGGLQIPIDNGLNSITTQTEFIGSISWTGGSSTSPAAGSTVTVNVTSVTLSGRTESLKETMLRRSIDAWGGSETRMLTGFRDTGGEGTINKGTGSFIDLESFYNDDAFTFTFIYPSSGCSISSTGMDWQKNPCFQPEFTEVSGYIYTLFEVNGSGGNFTNDAKGVVGQSSYGAAVYSRIGETLRTPTAGIARSGYRFTGWYTTAGCTAFIGSVEPETEADWRALNGATFYAGWSPTSNGGEYTYKVGDRARLAMAVRDPGGGMHLPIDNGNNSTFPSGASTSVTEKTEFVGSISWTGGTSTSPAAGSLVTVNVTSYTLSGRTESLRETMLRRSIDSWGASETRMLTGFRDTGGAGTVNEGTGSFIDLESFFGTDSYKFSFIFPATGCTINQGGMYWAGGNYCFEPELTAVDGYIYTLFEVNGSGGNFTNDAKGVVGQNSYGAAVYSKVGEALQTPTTGIVRSGYTFMGWYDSPTSVNTLPRTATADLNGTQYYAHWGDTSTAMYFISYYGNYGTLGNVLNMSVPVGNTFTVSECPSSVAGRTTVAWTTNADGSGTSYAVGSEFPSPTSTQSYTLYAKWENDTYKLKFDLKDGSFASGYTAPESYVYENGTISIPDPTRAGYEFIGWTGTGLSEATKNLTIDKHSNDKLGTHVAGTAVYERTYTATWRPYAYNVEFRDSEEDQGKIADDQSGFTYGTAKALAPANLQDAKPGYHVTGWKIGATDSTERVEGATGSLSTFDGHAPTGDDPVQTVKLYAEWTPNAYSVTLHDTVAGNADQTQTGFKYSTNNEASGDKELSQTNPAFTRTAYEIAGWALEPNGSIVFEGETPVIVSATLAANDAFPAEGGTLDLYAVWKPSAYTVTLNSAHVTSWDTTKAQGFTKAWDASLTTGGDNGAGTATNTYTVESGEELAIPGGATETGVVILPTPTANFYTFKGWTNVKDAAGDPVTLTTYTMATDDVRYGFVPSASGIHTSFTADAVWEEIEYPLTKMMVLDDSDTPDMPVAYEAGKYDVVPATGAFDWMYTVSGTTDGNALPALPTLPGYTFTGWSSPDDIICKADGSDFETSDFPVKTGAYLKANKTTLAKPQYKLVAHFTRDHHALRLDMNLSDAKLPDGALSNGASEGWKKADGAGNTYTYVDTAGHDGWSRDIAGGFIVLPVPERNGYTFTGWTVTDGQTVIAAVSGAGTAADPYLFKLPADKSDYEDFLMDYTLQAQWAQCDYAITLGNVLGHVKPSDGFATGAFESGSSQSVKTFKGSALGATTGITIGEPTEFVDGYATGFERWVTIKDMTGVTGWTKVSDEDAWWAKSFTITQANVEQYFGAGSANTSGQTHDFIVTAEFANAPYTATLDFTAGKVLATTTQPETVVAGGAISSEERTRTGWSTDERDYDCASDTIVLPKPTLYGYTFKGWEVSIDGGEYAAVVPATEGEHAGDYLLPHDSIGMRVYRPVWEKRTMKVQLHDNAASVGQTATPTAPGTPIDVVFGEPMPSVSVWPAVEGYDFTGYFDTAETSGGKQYYLADHASANLWDKAPKDDGTAYDLYGRWMKRDVAGETPMPAKGAAIALFAKDPADVLSVAFKATYNGTYTTTDDGRVIVSVDSYQFVDCSAGSIYAGFQKSEGETERFLLGFSIPSTGSFIPFTRFIEREQFEFEVLASELVAGIEAPSLTLGSALKPGTVVAVYTKDEITPGPGPGGEPVDPTPKPGQELTTIWNANGGTFTDAGNPVSKTSTTTVKPEGQKTYATPPAKNTLTRFGYDMVGWSKSKTHTASCECAEGGEIPLFELTSVVPTTYYAHWKAKESTVQFDNNGGTPAERSTVSGFAFGLSGTQLGVTEVGGTVLPAVPERTGYDFLGFFDAKTGGAQYFSSAGAQVRAWDKEPLANDPHVLYAQWAAKSGTGVTPTEPEKPNPVDPFPGIPTTPGTVITVVTKDPNNKVSIAAAIDGDADTRGTVIAGTYDGTVTYRTSKTSVPENYLPTGDDDVCVRLFTYSFDTQAVVKHFDEIAPVVDGKKQYLQGFEVPTTGSRVPLATLANGNTVEIIAKGSDLSGLEGETLASFAIRYTKMVPVYGPTPSIPLQTGGETWPVATPPNRTQVENIFDASMGRFGEGSTVRFQSVAAPYLGKLVFPTDDPAYNTAEGYHFDGWFTADGVEVTRHDTNGDLMRDAEGRLVAADTATVDSPYPATYYAHYKQTNFSLTFAAGETAEYPADEYPISNVPAAMDAYAGQPVSTVAFPSTSTAAGGFDRKGFDFVGWFAADGTPYYLTTAATGADRDAYDAFLATNPTIASAVTLTAKWAPITYTVVFRYDSGQSYVHKADNVTKTVKYGEVVADDFIPVPTNGGYTFNGWYASKSWATSSRVYDAKTGTRGSNYFTSDGRFKPTADAIPNPMEVFARFDVNASGITWYAITLETVDAAQGTVSNSTFPYNVTSKDVMMSTLEAQVNPKAGWAFDCLKEVTYDDDGNEVLTKVDFDRIPTGSTGDRTFRAFFVAKNDYKIDLNWGKKPEGVALNADDEELWGEDLSLPVTVEMTEPIALPSDFEVEGHLGYTFLGWFPVNAAGEVEQGAGAVATVTPSALIGDPTNENVTVFRYMALWQPKAYEVVFRYGETPSDEDFTVDVASYEDPVEMPVPATIANGKIFENWGAWHTDTAASGDWKTWTSYDEPVPFATLVDEVLRHQPGAVDDLENSGRVTLYANWGERVGATLPLQVNILIDPYLPEMKVGDAWIGTSASTPVQVESLTYEMVQDAGDVPGTESILTDADNTVRTGDFALMVTAGDGTAETLRIPLDGPGVVSRDLSGYGFTPFASGEALPVKYGLELPKLASGAVADLTPFTKVLMNPDKLLDKLDAKGDHVALPLAKLYYTIGLARDLPAEPNA